jgi:hypothetical protein
MPRAFSQNEHPFGQYGHFNQVEPFGKPWFLVVHVSFWGWKILQLVHLNVISPTYAINYYWKNPTQCIIIIVNFSSNGLKNIQFG